MLVITRVITFIFVLLCTSNIAHAALLFPTVQDIAVEQGEKEEFEIVVQNQEEVSKLYSVDFIGVGLGEQEGEYEFFELSESQKGWFSSELSSFELVSGEVREFAVEVSPDTNTEAQSFVAGVRVVESAVGDSGISVQSGFITLLFITIGDGILEDVEWLSFESEDTLSFGDLNAYFTVRNSGDRFAQPQGFVSLLSWTGNVVSKFDINPEFKRVVKGQDRTFAISIDTDWAFGPYEIRIDAQPWVDGDVYSDSFIIWFFSPRIIGLVVIGLIILVLIWRYAKRS